MKGYLLTILLITFSFTCGLLVYAVMSRIRNAGIIIKRSVCTHPEVPENTENIIDRDDLLFRLLNKGALFGMEFRDALKRITEEGSEIMGTGRVSVWIYNEDYSVLRCLDLYIKDRYEHRNGDELASMDFPSYQEAHMTELFIAAYDVLSDPRTKDIPESYFRENNIKSLLDTPVWNNDRIYGVISFEHTGDKRHWSRDDERLSMILANVVSLCMEREKRNKTEKELIETSKQLMSVGDNLKSGMVYQLIAKPDGTRKFTYISSGVMELHGITPDQVLYDPEILYSQILKEDLDSMIEMERHSIEKMVPFDVEVRFSPGYEKTKWARLYSHPRLMKNGDIIFDGIEIDITERKKQEALLKDSVKKFSMLYENMRDGVVEVTTDGKIINFNEAYRVITGYSSDELKNLFFKDITPEKWHESERKIIEEQLLTKGYTDIYEKEYIRKDGTVVPIDIRAYYIPGEQGTQGRMWGVVRDISERKKNEALLIESEENLRITMDSIGDAVISTDIEGKIVRMNPAASRITGWNKTAAQGKYITEIFRITDSGNRNVHLDPIKEVLNTGEVVFLEEDIILVSKYGEEHRIMDSAAPIINDSGELAGAVLVFRDLSEQLRLEHEALQSAEIFRAIFEASPYSIVIQKASDGSYLMVNPAFVKNTGYNAEEIIGKNGYEIGLYQDNDEYRDLTEQLKLTGKIDNFTMTSRNKNGITRFSLFSSRIIEFGNELCVLSVTMDITEQRHMQQQLNQANKMDAIGQLASGVAHDFNNMVGGIMGAVELLQIHAGNREKWDKYINLIKTTAEKAGLLTSKLLSFSRKGDYEQTPVDLHRIIEDTTELLKRTIDPKIGIKVNLNAEHSVINGDMSQLMNLFLNLGVNAWHAMPDGGELLFSTRIMDLDEHYCRINLPDSSPGRYILSEVQDTGNGIPYEYLSKIFEPFFTTKEKGKGTGLGLSTVYGTVKNHNGAITVYSEPGHGTLFHIYLPVSDLNIKEPADRYEIPRGSGVILIVDDEEIMRITAKEMLQFLGYRVIEAEDGKTALDIFINEHEHIDLVLLDMIMPVMNGHECFVELKKIKPEVKIVLSSGFIFDEHLKKMKEGRLAGYIMKPYQAADLGRIVAEVLSNS